MKKTKRNQQNIILTLVDINNFKQINDTLGHAYGDEILRVCADILVSITRDSDLVVRYGGDEFLIISFSESNNSDVLTVLMDRINEKVVQWNDELNTHNLPLSLSYGSSILDHKKSLDEVINEADIKMYEQKNIFKNRLDV